MKHKSLLIFAICLTVTALLFSILSLTKLAGTNKIDQIFLIPLRIINRDIILLSLAILTIIIYLWREK